MLQGRCKSIRHLMGVVLPDSRGEGMGEIKSTSYHVRGVRDEELHGSHLPKGQTAICKSGLT